MALSRESHADLKLLEEVIQCIAVGKEPSQSAMAASGFLKGIRELLPWFVHHEHKNDKGETITVRGIAALNAQMADLKKTKLETLQLSHLSDLHVHRSFLSVEQQTFLADITKQRLVILGKSQGKADEDNAVVISESKSEKAKKEKRSRVASSSLWE